MSNAVKPELAGNMADPFVYINGRVVIGRVWDPCFTDEVEEDDTMSKIVF
jgi:hypothetical protein